MADYIRAEDRKVQDFLPLDKERISPDPLLPTIEDMSGEEWDIRIYADTNQKYPTSQSHASRDQYGTPDSSPVRILPRIRDMLEKIRDRKESTKVFT